jgi:hypothetical protein
MQQFVARTAIDFNYQGPHSANGEVAGLEVELEYSGGRKTKVVALVASNSRCSQISARLAEELSINHAHERPCYVIEDLSVFNVQSAPILWHITRSPLTVYRTELGSIEITPVINSTFCFWDLILGQDFHVMAGPELWSLIFRSPSPPSPAPGPDFRPNCDYQGHNVRICRAEELPLGNIDTYVEFSHENSVTLKRLAINKVKRSMIVVFGGDDVIYYYDNVPDHLSDMIRHNFESKGKILSEIKRLRPVAQLECFPETLFCTRFGQRYAISAAGGTSLPSTET